MALARRQSRTRKAELGRSPHGTTWMILSLTLPVWVSAPPHRYPAIMDQTQVPVLPPPT
jgi:hypothetical protein